ncbi:hypothetical protein HD806DRAFT_539211 [Xylariaceae sp. AK1471]|nr:hypothetical protein HD806DRAFT_539211 [Xylariaceae sp. AK1471]
MRPRVQSMRSKRALRVAIPERPRVFRRCSSAVLDTTPASVDHSTHPITNPSTRLGVSIGYEELQHGNIGVGTRNDFDQSDQGDYASSTLFHAVGKRSREGSNANNEWEDCDECLDFNDEETSMINGYLSKMGLSTVDQVVKYPPTWLKHELQVQVWQHKGATKSLPLKESNSSQLPLWFDPSNLVGFRSAWAEWRYSPRRLSVVVRYKLLVLKKDGFEDWRDCRFTMIYKKMKPE